MTENKPAAIEDFEGTTINTMANPEVSQAMRKCSAILMSITARYPEWGALFEDTDPFSAPAEDLLELLKSAPTDSAAMLIFGYYSARVEIAAMTGRPFV